MFLKVPSDRHNRFKTTQFSFAEVNKVQDCEIGKMLQIRNTGSGKSEWNVGETHLIIPMIDGDLISNKEREKILTSAITLNPLEGSEQAILTNALEHSLVVGLDKNLFESTSYKSDLLIIQNSDLKLLQCNPDIKVAHTLSDVEQDKNEILWQNPILKDRISGSEKAIFEVKQVLNYDNIDLEKTTKQINLGSTSSSKPSEVVEANKELLADETMNQENNITDSSFVINFDSETDKSKSLCITLNPEISKAFENIKSVEKKKPFQSDVHSDLNDAGPYKLEESFNANSQMVSYSDSLPLALVDCSKEEIDRRHKIMLRKTSTVEDFKMEGDRWNDGINNFFWEKNLPLKKKAKMKRTLMAISLENQKGLLKDDIKAAQEQERVLTRRNTKQTIPRPQKKQEPESSDSESSKNRVGKPKKLKLDPENPLNSEVKEDLTKTDSSFGEDEMTAIKAKSFEFVATKFNDIYELVEGLLKCRIINTTVWQTLNSGLKEMKVDILKEMLLKRKEHCSLESLNYSPQLKAFALVLYFEQPAAFNHLSQVFKSGWPSLKVIKEWKRRMNTRRRRKFLRAQSDSETKKS